MQRLLMDRNTNNLTGTFYHVGGKTHHREKSGLANMFKPKESEKEAHKDTHRDSPTRRPMKYTSSQRDIKLNEDKAMMFEIVPLKSYRRVDGEFKLGEMTQRPTSRQKSGITSEKETPTKSPSNYTHATPQRYFNSSNDRSKQKSISHLADSTPSHSESVIKKSHKVLELDHDRQSFASSLYHSRVSPARHQEAHVKPFEYIPLDGSKGYKTASRQAESGQVTERRDNAANKKLHRRGLSIDQISNLGLIDKAQTSRRVEKGSRHSRDEIMGAASPTERRLTGSRIMEQQQQQQQQQMLLQQQQLEKQLKQQLKQQLEQQQQQQQQQQIVIVNNEADQIKYFEKLLHIDKMSFDFEKQMVLRRQKKQQLQQQQQSPQPTPIMTTTANTKHTMHSRTRSMEEQPSLQQTKSSSRWNTKRSRGEDGNLIGDDTVDLPEPQENFRGF